MTEPSQYFKGRTVQEQMNEVIGYVDTRAAEVATTAIASDVAQVHQDMLDADADAQAAAASAAAAAGTLANAVKKTGESSQTVEGDITMSTGDLGVAGDVGVQGQLSVLGGCDLRAPVTVAAPVNNTDAANKKYVDDSLSGYVPMVRTTGNQTIAGEKKISLGVINISNKSKSAGTPTNLIRHSIASSVQDYRSYFIITASGNPVIKIVMLQYTINPTTKVVTMSELSRSTVLDGDTTNTATYSVFVDDNSYANVAITSVGGQMYSCIPLNIWVGGRFGVTVDMDKYGDDVTIPVLHGEVTL